MRIAVLLCGVLAVAPVHAAWGFGSAKAGSADVGTPVDPASPPSTPEAPTAPITTPLSRPSPAPYAGTQYKFAGLYFRPAELVHEAVILALLALYAAASFLGARTNLSRARTWFHATSPFIKAEFAAVGVSPTDLIQDDGSDEYVTYATGRRAVESCQVNVKTKPRHDVLVSLYNFARTAADFTYESGADRITFNFVLRAPTGTPGSKFVFGLVKREYLKKVRDEHWALRTFTNTSEFAGLPPSLIAMTESGEFSAALLKSPDVGLLEALNPKTEGSEYFESLVITDMPSETPDEYALDPTLPTDLYRMVLTLRLPAPGDSLATAPYVALMCNIADVIVLKPKLVSDIAVAKLKKKRAEVLATLRKSLTEEQAAAAEEKKVAALALKRKLEKEREEAKLQGMSKAERVKAIEKMKAQERKDLIKKMSKKQKP